MMPSGISDSLLEEIKEAVGDPHAIVSVRDENNCFIYVNGGWEGAAERQAAEVIGKTLGQLDILPPVELRRFQSEDDEARRRGHLVIVRRYTVNETPRSLLAIRAVITHEDQDCLVEVSYLSWHNVPPDNLFGWSSQAAESAIGEAVAARLRNLSG
jgi:PAS domain-containing protein